MLLNVTVVCVISMIRVLVASQHRYMVNTMCRIYSKLPPDDEELICLKHIEDDY